MAVARRSGAFAYSYQSNQTTAVLTPTSSPQSGDTIIVVALQAATGTTFSVPSGFSKIAATVTDGQTAIQAWAKRAGASEPPSYTFTSNGGFYGPLVLHTYSGAAEFGPLSFWATDTASGTAVDWPDITALAGGAALIAATETGGATFTTPDGWTAGYGSFRGKTFDIVGPDAGTLSASSTSSLTDSFVLLSVFITPTLQAPSNLSAPVVTGNNWSGQTLSCTTGSWLGVLGVSSPYTYQWQRDGSDISGATSSTYTLTTDDIGSDITCVVTATNTEDSTSATSNAITGQFHNTAKPSFTGTPGAGNVYTAVAGTYDETVTARTYAWLADNKQVATGDTYTQDESDGSRRITVREDVTGPDGSGTATSTTNKIFYAMTVPFASSGTIGNPYRQALPEDVAIDNAMTSTLQGYLTAQYAAGKFWYGEGGPYGSGYAEFLNVVDSSMPRTAFDLAPLSSYGGTPETATKNGTARTHLAWCWKTKNDGVPTPPGGFKVAPGDDGHMAVYCHDTDEFWASWRTNLTTYDNPRFWAGCYIPDVTLFVGYFQDLTTAAGTDADPEKQFAAWGEQAVNMPMWEGILTQRELMVDGEIDHAVGILMPGSNHTARWPNTRSEASGTGSMPLGGIWQVDPDLDPASLSSLGNATLNELRRDLISALQTYGAIPIDTTNANFGIRFESVSVTADSYTWGSVFSPTLDSLIKSIPTTSWRVISSSYRPEGGPQLPTPAAISTQHLLPTGDWDVFGGSIDGTGRLSLGAYGGDGGQGYTKSSAPLSLDDSAMYVNMVQVAATTRWQAKLLGASGNYIGFEYSASTGNLSAIAAYNGSAVATTVSVTYSATTHAWWRIRVEDDTIIWETSEDSGSGTPASWTEFRSTAVPETFFELDNVRVYFQALGSTIGVSDGTMIARNLSEVPAPVATSAGWVVGVA